MVKQVLIRFFKELTSTNSIRQGLDQGLVASLLSMRGDLRGWGLGNIQETEDETLV